MESPSEIEIATFHSEFLPDESETVPKIQNSKRKTKAATDGKNKKPKTTPDVTDTSSVLGMPKRKNFLDQSDTVLESSTDIEIPSFDDYLHNTARKAKPAADKKSKKVKNTNYHNINESNEVQGTRKRVPRKTYK